VAVAPEDEAFTLPGTSRPDGQQVGVLLCHGFTGTPSSMRAWGEHLAAEGYAVSAPRLPGHGTTWQEMNGTTYDDWYGEAERAFEKLQTEADQVFVGGLSMGGMISLNLAMDKGRDVRGLLLVNPVVHGVRNDVQVPTPLKYAFMHLVPSVKGVGNDVMRPGVVERAYPRTPLRAAYSFFSALPMVRQRLPEVTQPLLMFRSRVDHVLDPSSGRIIMTSVSSRDLEERVLENSYHVATLDNDAPAIFSGSAEFLRRVSGAAAGDPGHRGDRG